MKKNLRHIFKQKDYLLDEPEVQELLDYCEELQEELIEANFKEDKNKEAVLREMLEDILASCRKVQKEQEEHLRFGYPPADFEAAIENLKKYIIVRCKDEKIYIN